MKKKMAGFKMVRHDADWAIKDKLEATLSHPVRISVHPSIKARKKPRVAPAAEPAGPAPIAGPPAAEEDELELDGLDLERDLALIMEMEDPDEPPPDPEADAPDTGIEIMPDGLDLSVDGLVEHNDDRASSDEEPSGGGAAAADPPKPPLLEANITIQRQVYKEVLEACRASRQALHAASKLSQASPANRPFEDKEISLVIDDGVVTFVYWEVAATRKGRRLGLNPNNTIKALFFGRSEIEDFSGADMIVSRPPVIYIHRGASMADRCPDWVLNLRQHEEFKLFSGPLAGKMPRDCVLCKHASGHGVSHMMDSDMYGCAHCLAVWHYACGFHTGKNHDAGFVMDINMCFACQVSGCVARP